jgi:hypothetical protein
MTRTPLGGYIARNCLLTPYGRDCAACLTFTLIAAALSLCGHLGGFLGLIAAALWILRLCREVPRA